MHVKEGSMRRGKGGDTHTHIHTHNSLFTHTQQLPGRPTEETNTGKEENRGALPLSRQGEVAASILRDPAWRLFLGGWGGRRKRWLPFHRRWLSMTSAADLIPLL